MKRNFLVAEWGALALALAGLIVQADEPAERKPAPPPEQPSGTKSAGDAKPKMATIPDAASRPVVITNTVTMGGRPVTYTAETGMLPLLKQDGDSRASVFYVAYTRLESSDRARRPVMFCFNGGPGSSSVWLHLGGLGPRRVKLNDDGSMPPPPFGLEDNELSILAATDLVFIDPVATGYSRPVKDEKPDQFFGQLPDVESIGDFIRLWTTRNERWRSPKYLCGESYGAFRAAGLAEHLHSRYGLYLNGIVLLSGVLDFATLREVPGNELPYIVFLPALTATAHYHKKLPADLQADLGKAIRAAREFARGDYALALLRGSTLTPEEREDVAARLVRLTGLPRSLIEDHELQVSSYTFREHLRREEGLILGRFDARITGRDADKRSAAPLFDPSYASAYGPFSAAMNAYVREELQFTNDLPYEVIAGVKPWDFETRDSYPNVSGKLASVMSQNPSLRVLVLVGLRDLATPMDGMRHSLDHLQIDPVLRRNLTLAEYESGHMMYVNKADLRKLQKDLEEFLKP
ncbi:MAG: peptidase S10 [Verrucomicrobia bacterium]|jgi:carboxypeptidase C (cathepsin A)|nr:peptidase S10 [Verrucomicrobiota bacterium]